ncbi:outer membrane beta-barrel protein [Massilia sp. H-1]|nr:outer membrane beta-barrel protein [Massilia sp. H-1]
MKKFAFSIALAIASMGAAHAQAPAANDGLHFFLGASLTFGGDKLAKLEYTNGTDSSVTAGGLVQLQGGVEYRINSDFAVQTSIGYHVSDATASDGSIRFTRMPIELIGYYSVAPQWRISAKRAMSAMPSSRPAATLAYRGHVDFDNTIGALVEAEYMISPKAGVKMRIVSEKYETTIGQYKVDGNHVGGFFNYYF